MVSWNSQIISNSQFQGKDGFFKDTFTVSFSGSYTLTLNLSYSHILNKSLFFEVNVTGKPLISKMLKSHADYNTFSHTFSSNFNTRDKISFRIHAYDHAVAVRLTSTLVANFETPNSVIFTQDE